MDTVDNTVLQELVESPVIIENETTDLQRWTSEDTCTGRLLDLTAGLITVTLNRRQINHVGCRVVAMQIGVVVKIANTAASFLIDDLLCPLPTDLEELLRECTCLFRYS